MHKSRIFFTTPSAFQLLSSTCMIMNSRRESRSTRSSRDSKIGFQFKFCIVVHASSYSYIQKCLWVHLSDLHQHPPSSADRSQTPRTGSRSSLTLSPNVFIRPRYTQTSSSGDAQTRKGPFPPRKERTRISKYSLWGAEDINGHQPGWRFRGSGKELGRGRLL